MDKIPVLVFLVVAISTSFLGRGIALNNVSAKGEVLSQAQVVGPSPTFSPSPSPPPIPRLSPSPTPIPRPSIRPSPTPKPTPPPSLQPQFTSEEIYHFTDKFAGDYGVDANVLRHIAICESGFRPQAKNLSYAGLFQFSPSCWAKYRQMMGEDPSPDLRFHAEEAVQTAAYVLSLKQGSIWPNCMPKN